MIEDVSRFIDFLGDHNMTSRQFLLCWILFLDKREHKGNPLPDDGPAIANIYRFVENVGGWHNEEIEDLVQRGYLVDRGSDPRNIYPDDLVVTDKFVDEVLATQSQFEEIWETYPAFMDNFEDQRKDKIPLKAAVKEDIEEMFYRRCKSKKRFEKMLQALQWAKKHGKIKMGIKKWLGGEYWKAHYEEMSSDSQPVRRTVI